MGINIISVCHRCKERLGHLRRKEKLIDFCRKHDSCGRISEDNIQIQADCFDELDYKGYKDVFDEYYPEQLKI